jgi:predicted small lipoprotein YifL
MSGGIVSRQGVSPPPADLLSWRPIQERQAVKLGFAHIAVIGALATAFALAGCGRKGPLDPPPSAAVAQPAQAASQGPRGAVNPLQTGQEAPAAPAAFDAQGRPMASRGVKKPLPMDWLIE